MITTAVTLLAGTAVVLAGTGQPKEAVYDDFEAPTLSRAWETRKLLPGALKIQSSVVRAGKGAARITLRPGDQIAKEKGSALERAELEEARALRCVEGSTYEYSFSLLLPRKFLVVPTRLVIAQWKQACPVEACTPENPVVAVRYQDGELSIDHRFGNDKQVLYRTRDQVRGRWLDFRFQLRFSTSASGRIKVWLGETVIVDYTGVTAYPATGGYVERGAFYFKMGLYRDRVAQPMTIYLDEYRKQPLPAGAP